MQIFLIIREKKFIYLFFLEYFKRGKVDCEVLVIVIVNSSGRSERFDEHETQQMLLTLVRVCVCVCV